MAPPRDWHPHSSICVSTRIIRKPSRERAECSTVSCTHLSCTIYSVASASAVEITIHTPRLDRSLIASPMKGAILRLDSVCRLTPKAVHSYIPCCGILIPTKSFSHTSLFVYTTVAVQARFLFRKRLHTTANPTLILMCYPKLLFRS